jgi:hypothetical protein
MMATLLSADPEGSAFEIREVRAKLLFFALRRWREVWSARAAVARACALRRMAAARPQVRTGCNEGGTAAGGDEPVIALSSLCE